jgi:hypothetical protein
MAKRQEIPNPLERRHLVERDVAAEQSLRLADAYLEEGRTWEAIAFLHKAGARERLVALREEAVAAGDAFLVRELVRVLRDELSTSVWQRVADAARAAGKDRYAAQAQQLAQRAEGRT